MSHLKRNVLLYLFLPEHRGLRNQEAEIGVSPSLLFLTNQLKDFLSFQPLVSFLFIRNLFPPRSKVIVSLNEKLILTSDT